MDAQGLYFSALLKTGLPTGLKLVKRDHLSEDWHPVFDWIVSFCTRESKLPAPETLEAQFGRTLPTATEDVGFYAGQVLENRMRIALEDKLTEQVVAPLKEAKAGEALEGARKVVIEVGREFRRQQHSGLVVPDFAAKEQVTRRMADYYRRKASKDRIGLPLPWPAITRATNGLVPSAYWYLLARPEIGKTWVMVVLATWYWQMGLRVLFVSMEMPAEGNLPKDPRHRVLHGFCLRCYQPNMNPKEVCPAGSIPAQQLSVRFDAIGARLSAWRLLKGLLTPHEERDLRTYYERLVSGEMPWGSLRIVAAPYISSAVDLQMEILEHAPDVLLLDSWYRAIGDATDVRKNEAAGALVRQTEDIIRPMGIPTVVSWHLNRDVKEDAINASINDAILTDEIARAPDVVLGMFRPPEYQMAGEALWRGMKVREGIAMRELKTHFRVKDEINFAEIGEVPRKEDLKDVKGK